MSSSLGRREKRRDEPRFYSVSVLVNVLRVFRNFVVSIIFLAEDGSYNVCRNVGRTFNKQSNTKANLMR